MYNTFLALHNMLRWLVVFSMLFAVIMSLHGLLTKRAYGRMDKLGRIFSVSFVHLQLIIGLALYGWLSPIMKLFMKEGAGGNEQLSFLGISHLAGMLLAVIAVTVGSSVAKRAATDQAKFRRELIWFSIAFILILAAIPWFRPHFRPF
ncbi:MAG: hypothetical protein AAGC85_18025 [Bacteroidota bacterium]